MKAVAKAVSALIQSRAWQDQIKTFVFQSLEALMGFLGSEVPFPKDRATAV